MVRQYKRSGTIVSVMGSTFSSDVAMLKKLRKAAADLGADAVHRDRTISRCGQCPSIINYSWHSEHKRSQYHVCGNNRRDGWRGFLVSNEVTGSMEIGLRSTKGIDILIEKNLTVSVALLHSSKVGPIWA